MKKIGNNAQSGYALIIVVLLLMTMGGVVIAGYTQGIRRDVEQSRFEHNQRLLVEAKQALLMYAYNYPTNNPGRGPGRLPCPDTDLVIDGIPNPLPDCTDIGVAMVGRLPNLDPDLNLYSSLNTRRTDASGEDLWYAVSPSFANLKAGLDVVNSNSTGTITLFDQTGNLVHDGADATARTGIAAVIIAPGPITQRDEDDNGSYEYTQLRNNAVQRNLPANYLDTFPGGFDNSGFVNGGNNNADGFILGPSFDPNVNDYMVNDQFIVITADEVIAMAEQSVLDTYQDAINTYLTNTVDIYPWLDSFVTNDLLTAFDADINSFKGRVPAVFSSYFTGDEVDAYASDTKIRMELPVAAPAPGGVIIHTAPAVLTDVSFDAGGDLVTSVNSPYTITRYFWDGHPTEADTLPMDGVWEMCPVVTNDEEDCNQDNFGVFIGGSDSAAWLQIYKLTITLNSGVGPLEFADGELISAGPYQYIPATSGEQAYVFGNYRDSVLTDITISWEYDLDFWGSFDIQAFGNLNEAAVGVIYYPELPDWALSDGWHHSVQMAIAEDYKPDGNNTDCTINGCLVVTNLGGINDDKISLLVIAGEVDDLVDDGAAGFFDDLTAQFEAQNDTANITYDRRAGNDSVLVLQ